MEVKDVQGDLSGGSELGADEKFRVGLHRLEV